MQTALEFQPLRLPEHVQQLRAEVRTFIQSEIDAGTFDPDLPEENWKVHKRFAKKVGQRGWIGMTWPRRYGGQERSFLDRFVVNEEMIASNAPNTVYFTADRQSGPTLIKYASERIKSEVLPKIIAGEACFCIGMSEPNSGSDLFAARCKGDPNGRRLEGQRIEDLDHQRPSRRLYDRLVPYQRADRQEPPPRSHLLPGRYEGPRHYLQPDRSDERSAGFQRSRIR
jgi:alkylation response protein AidB-like acyl-CoA dehydrogenase